MSSDPVEIPNFEFDIDLTARSTDTGGIAGSFSAQLANLGGEATLISQSQPQRVDSSGHYWFEVKRLYRISM